MYYNINSILKEQGFNFTKSRENVFQAILRYQPATMNQLVQAVPDSDRATIYRTIQLFVDLGIAKKVYTGFKYRIELGDDLQEHHHHLTCLRCKSVIDISTPEIEYAIEQTATDNGFRAVRHDLEIAGYCAQCS